MNLGKVKKPQKRFDLRYLSAMNIQAYGRDNLYPQRMLDLIQNSPTGGTCLDRYARFIEGAGLEDETLAGFICNRQGDTVNDILHMIAEDMAKHHGFAVHVNYNMMGQIVELQHVHFESCRLEEEDDLGNVAYINIHPDWTGNKTRNGKKIQVNKDNVQKFHVFNPNPYVVLAQIAKAGGIDKYQGQVLWYSMDGRFIYPTPKYDKVVTDLSIDDGLDNVKYRNVRNNFLLAGVFIHKKAATGVGVDENGQPLEDDDDENNDIAEALDVFQGDTNACSIMDITVNSEEDYPDFKTFEAQNFDKKFEATEKSTVERIYAAFEQEVFYAIRIGKLGFSGDVIDDAFSYYNSVTGKVRREISRQLRKIFVRFSYEDNGGKAICPSDSYEILPVEHISNESTSTKE
ncbi:MAG: hypothetical protein IJ551_06075 [Prevotella sp.]|nr:hypothetical protein [Prevotella sp.]